MADQYKWPIVKKITLDDLNDVVVAGIQDFREAPKFGLCLSLFYAFAGWSLVFLLWQLGMPFLAYPLAMGFALLAPFAASAFYAVSDLRERSEVINTEHVYFALKKAARRDLGWMALVLCFALILWLEIAAVLTFTVGGINTFDADYFHKFFETPSGLALFLLGNTIGALIAFAIFAISVISFPMLYDRDIDFVTAMVTSVRLVEKNPVSMLAWCAFIGLIIVLSVMSAFFGLFVLLPIIGPATWHLYRRAVEPQV
ncbi:MAG: DUF2189 domain-containing protein [Hyphomicrobium sp.]